MYIYIYMYMYMDVYLYFFAHDVLIERQSCKTPQKTLDLKGLPILGKPAL